MGGTIYAASPPFPNWTVTHFRSSRCVVTLGSLRRIWSPSPPAWLHQSAKEPGVGKSQPLRHTSLMTALTPWAPERLGERFWPAFLVVLEDFAEEDYFAQHCSDECSDGFPHYWDAKKVERRLIGVLGRVEWPIAHDSLTDERIVELVEAFFTFVSKPTDSWFHQYCGSSHPTAFDSAAGRYEYTVKVNKLFEQFGAGRRLRSGEVTVSGSALLAPRLREPLPFNGDPHLERLVTTGIAKFQNTSLQDRWEGLRSLVDAYERIKSAEHPSNKRESVAALIGKLAPHERLAAPYDALFRELTALANEMTIRHHEYGRTEILSDAELIDFLFYSYYNLIRYTLLTVYSD